MHKNTMMVYCANVFCAFVLSAAVRHFITISMIMNDECLCIWGTHS